MTNRIVHTGVQPDLHNELRLEARREFERQICEPFSDWNLFLFGEGANAYDTVLGVDVWIHGTVGGASLQGYGGRYFAVAIEKAKAVHRESPHLCVVDVVEYPDSDALLRAHPWRRNSDGSLGLFTYCNWSVSFCRSMVFEKPGLQYGAWGGAVKKQWVANELWRELARTASSPHGAGRDEGSWVCVAPRDAQAIANRGGFVVAVSASASGSGHIVFLSEDGGMDRRPYDASSSVNRTGLGDIRCVHVGRGAARRTTLSDAFTCLRDAERTSQGQGHNRVRFYCDRNTWRACSAEGSGELSV